MKKTNHEHLLELGVWKTANALLNLMSDTCAYCPRDRELRCNEDCRAGLREWLCAPYIPSSSVWKEETRR